MNLSSYSRRSICKKRFYLLFEFFLWIIRTHTHTTNTDLINVGIFNKIPSAFLRLLQCKINVKFYLCRFCCRCRCSHTSITSNLNSMRIKNNFVLIVLLGLFVKNSSFWCQHKHRLECVCACVRARMWICLCVSFGQSSNVKLKVI